MPPATLPPEMKKPVLQILEVFPIKRKSFPATTCPFFTQPPVSDCNLWYCITFDSAHQSVKASICQSVRGPIVTEPYQKHVHLSHMPSPNVMPEPIKLLVNHS